MGRFWSLLVCLLFLSYFRSDGVDTFVCYNLALNEVSIKAVNL